MALAAKLQMRQSQSLVMTPQLLQSIRLLQYGQAQLNAFVEGEIERNPLLRPSTAPASLQTHDSDGSTALDGDASDDGSASRNAANDRTSPDHVGAGADYADAERVSAPVRTRERTARGSAFNREHQFDIEDFGSSQPSLRDHALAEARDIATNVLDRRIAEAIADELDDCGYARVSTESLAAEFGVASERVDSVLDLLRHHASPPGLFASDLADCLMLQLHRRDRLDPVMASVLKHLDLLARRDFAALRRLTGEDEAGLMDILAEIRMLDPKPGHAYAHEIVETVVPDVIVSETADGGWQVEINPQSLPRVLIDNDYLAKIKGGALRESDRSFVGECQQSANWLVRSLDQRANTIVKVAGEIVRRQEGFLKKGVGALKPMTLMSVADAIGMHESTVSRVTANKFVATPRGTFDMRFFFTVAIASANGGDAHSAESVKLRIRMLIDAESPGNVMSDDDIAAVLKREGIDLARRTVAKYREALGLPSSIQRRREMNARRMAS